VVLRRELSKDFSARNFSFDMITKDLKAKDRRFNEVKKID
jgi:hypothetical protein